MKRWISMGIVMFLAACGTVEKTPKTMAPLEPAKSAASMLFPYGKYKHEVSVHVVKGEDGKPQNYNFSGYVETSADVIRLVALSMLGTTIMKINEDRKTGNAETEIYVERLKKAREQIHQLYALLRQVLVMKKSGAENIKATRISSGSTSGEVRFSNYKDGMPQLVQVSVPQFELGIKVTRQ